MKYAISSTFIMILVYAMPVPGTSVGKAEAIAGTGSKDIVVSSNILTITGTLMESVLAPAKHKEVWGFEGKIGSVKIGKDGKLLNPTAKTNAKGQFVLKIDRTVFLLSNLRIAVVYKPNPTSSCPSASIFQNRNGAKTPIQFIIKSGTTGLDLGKIMIEIKK